MVRRIGSRAGGGQTGLTIGTRNATTNSPTLTPMANPQAVKALDAGGDTWATYRQQHPTPDLTESNLREARLTGANLYGAELAGAYLAGADLAGANLAGAHLGGANLTRANLAEAKFAGTQLTNLDLTDTDGLDAAVHEGPSSLGVDTLYRSRGEIPDKFLRGVGLTSLFITYARDTINAEAGPLFAFYSAFLSYSHADREPVRAIYDQLTKRGIPCWLDEHQLNPGDKLDPHIDAAIRGADKLVVFCSETSLSPGTNWWVDREVGRALDEERERSRRKKNDTAVLVPVALDGYLFSDECTYSRKRDLTNRTVATHSDTGSTVADLVAALSTSNNRPYQPFFHPNRHT